MSKLHPKFWRVLVILTSVLLIWSCESDIPGVEDQSLVGVWVTLSVEESECTVVEDNAFTTLICTDQTCVTFDFRDDLTFVGVSLESGVAETVTGTYTVNGSEYSITANGETVTGTFSVVGDNLILNSVDSDSGCNVEATLKKQ